MRLAHACTTAAAWGVQRSLDEMHCLTDTNKDLPEDTAEDAPRNTSAAAGAAQDGDKGDEQQ